MDFSTSKKNYDSFRSPASIPRLEIQVLLLYVSFFCLQLVKFPFLLCQSGQVIGDGGEACKVVLGPSRFNSIL